MKKIVTVLFAVFIASACFSSTIHLFEINKQEIENQFAPLEQFDLLFTEKQEYLNNSVTSGLVNDMKLLSKIEIINLSNTNVMGVPAGMLSLLLGPVGIATTHNKAELSRGKVILIVVGVIIVVGVTYYIIQATNQTSDSCNQGLSDSMSDACSDSCSNSSSSSSSSCGGDSSSGACNSSLRILEWLPI